MRDEIRIQLNELHEPKNNIGIVFTMDEGRTTLFYDEEDYYFWTPDEGEFNIVINKLGRLKFEGRSFEIFVDYDKSGFKYYTEKEKDFVNLSISTYIADEGLLRSEVSLLKSEFDKIKNSLSEITVNTKIPF